MSCFLTLRAHRFLEKGDQIVRVRRNSQVPGIYCSLDLQRLHMFSSVAMLWRDVFLPGGGGRLTGGAEGVRRGATELQVVHEEGQNPGRGEQV